MSGSGARPESPSGAPGGEGAAPPTPGTEPLLAGAFDSNPAGLALLVGEELRFARVNPAYRALTPSPEVDPLGRRFDEVWPAEDPAVVAAFRRALLGGEPWHDDDHPVSSAGTLRRFSRHVRRVEEGGRAALLLVVWETTPLWQARAAALDAAWAAQRHASELDAMVDAIADGFLLYGPRGEVLRMNAVAERLLPLAPEERAQPARARWGRGRVTGADGTPLRFEETPLARALAGETVRSAHLRVEAPGGRVWVVASAAPIRAPGGVILGAVVTFSDESAIHALEEARDDLVRMVSHDLRSPLNAIVAQVHLLRRAPDDAAKVEERARSIVRSCERMNAMIADLLEATLLEAGQLRMHIRSIDLAAAVEDVLERQRGALAMDRVRFSSRGAPPPVAADPDRLERIVVNLVSNALKYSPGQGEVTVEVTAAEGGATLTVTDHGVGIAPEDLVQVFERFFRARGARRPEGLGLGLYITRLLVDAHGGRIDAESRLGQGSTFRVFLPEVAPLRPPGGRT